MMLSVYHDQVTIGEEGGDSRMEVDALLLELSLKLAAGYELRSAYPFCLVSLIASFCSNTTVLIYWHTQKYVH